VPNAGNKFFLGDFNGDGALDVLSSHSGVPAGSASAGLRLGNGDGTFQSLQWPSLDRGASAATDFNGDGHLDFAGGYFIYGSQPVANWRAYLGNGDGTLEAREMDIGLVNSFADFNSDGLADAYGRSSVDGPIGVLLGNGDATFQPLQSFATGSGSKNPIARDLNGDDLSDLIVLNDDGFSVLLNDGAWDGPPPPPPPIPALNVSDTTVSEGHAGTAVVSFTVRLSSASTQPVTVAYATGNGTATAGSDYQAVSGTVTFAPGETSKTLTVPISGDRLVEPNETFVVNLREAANAVIADGQGVGAILDDEPRISINSVTVKEGNSGTRLMTFTVTLSAAYDQAVTVRFATENGSARAGEDYVAKSGTLTFNPGQTTKTFTVTIKGDKKKEDNEDFYVRLTSAGSNALVEQEYGYGIIEDDDRRRRW
jgi:hypothetical protein